MSEINWNKYPTGTFFTCILNERSCQGRIYKCDNNIYLLQNDHDGGMPSDENTLEFTYSWSIGDGSNNSLDRNQTESLKLIKDPNFVQTKVIDRAKLIHKGRTSIVRLNDRKTVAEIIKSPFSNCQIMSMKSAYVLQYHSTSELIAIYTALLKYKRVLVIDILQDYTKSILPRKKDLYLYKTKYENTTGSKMVIAAIDLRKMIEHLKNKLGKS